ncbi:hypothetical protein KM043_017343 [Ampulex compressa]|nr:hypothetical protein KM043_017343 [Ampulex compressa]
MSIAEKIGYIAIAYWGYRFGRIVLQRMFYEFFVTRPSIDLTTMGKWAVVTGCSHGIGKAYVESLARLGLNVILVSPETEKLRAIAADIEALYNVKTKTMKLDLAEGMEAYNAIEREMFGLEIGVLINNLGMSYPHPEYFLDLPHKERIYMNIIDCNVVVPTNMCRIVLPQMVVRGKGVIVNVSSMVAVIPSPLLTVFAATKAYVVKFSRDLQIEYAKHGIVVQCLLPGTLTNHTADSPRAGWLVPTPDKYVQSAIQSIGREAVTTGFPPHTVLVGTIKLIYRISQRLVILWMLNVMEGVAYGISGKGVGLREMLKINVFQHNKYFSQVKISILENDRIMSFDNVLKRDLIPHNKKNKHGKRGKNLIVSFLNVLELNIRELNIKRILSAKRRIMDKSKYRVNSFEDYPSSDIVVTPDLNTIHDSFLKKIATGTKELLNRLELNQDAWRNTGDYSIYTGEAGIAYMFFKYGEYFNETAYINKATQLLERSVNQHKKTRKITFLTGIAGPIALAAVVLHSQAKYEDSVNMISMLKSLSAKILKGGDEFYDELLYGRAGYLYSLLYVKFHIPQVAIEDKLISQIATCIIRSGQLHPDAKNSLMYSWHNKEYVGAAHGLAGILYVLLQAREYLTKAQLEQDVLSAVRNLQKLRFPSGNFISSIGSQTDRLVQWCHGAPGMTALFCLAFKVYNEPKFLETAIECGEVVWERGILQKGYGLCHGVAGNAYSFLDLFQQTQDIKYLHRACKFAEWCMNYGKYQDRIPDRPFSLFEGLAGVIYFLIDLQKPNNAKFPGYSI